MMRVLGQPAGPCRMPMGPEPAGLEQRAREVLAALQRARGPRPDADTNVTEAAPPPAAEPPQPAEPVPAAAG